MSDLAALQTRLGYTFREENLLRLALTHPSVAHEQGVRMEHNQRLEFLGDAVLQLIFTEYLFDQYQKLGEGQLTKIRARIVSREGLQHEPVFVVSVEVQGKAPVEGTGKSKRAAEQDAAGAFLKREGIRT